MAQKTEGDAILIAVVFFVICGLAFLALMAMAPLPA